MKEYIYVPEASDSTLRKVVEALLNHLELDAIRTDETKHGNVEVRVEPRQ